MERFIKAAAAAALILCLVLMVGAAPAHAETQGAATVTASALNLRSEASASSSVVACLPRGATVLVTGTSGGWYQVVSNGRTGYMSADYLSFSSSADVDLGTGTITGNGVRVRSGPGTSYGVVTTADSGAAMSVSGVSGAWYKVSYNGQTGYVSSTYLRLGGGGSSAGTAVSAASGTGTITGSGVRLRSGPGTSYSVLGTYGSGTQMTVTGQSGDWYQVSYNGQTGYVYKTYLSLSGGGSAPAASYTVTAMDSTEAMVVSPVNMRSGPGTSYASDRVLGTGTAVTITGQSGSWYRVSYNGAEGYIFRTYLTTRTPSSASSPASSSEGQRIVDTAKKYLGVPYVYGGTSPSGFDCSGLVYYVYRECGYSITRTATAQNSVGSYVSRDSLQPGDIIIFYNSAMSAIGHAGIYVGDGQFIHASSGSGKVIISNLSSSYYNTHYYSARRVV